MSTLARSFFLCALLLGCHDAAPTTDRAAVVTRYGTATMPRGWRPLPRVAESVNVLTLGAWEHPDFPSVIKVTVFTGMHADQIPALMATSAATAIAQGYAIREPQILKNGDALLSMEDRDTTGRAYAESLMYFRPAGAQVMVITGMWPADEQQAGLAAFTETLNGIRTN